MGTTDAGGWHYSYLYDTVSHFYPDLSEQARPIHQNNARMKILMSYFASVGVSTTHEIQRLFQWKPDQISPALTSLTASGYIDQDIEIEEQRGKYYAINQLF